MKVMEIWRYPVKTMAGEKLQRVHLGSLGINGDRVVHIEDAKGRVITSRSHPRFLGHKGSLGADGSPMVDGRPWNSPEVAAEAVDIGGPGTKLFSTTAPSASTCCRCWWPPTAPSSPLVTTIGACGRTS